MRRIVDVVAVAAVAVVLLLPKPSVDAHVALVGDKVELDHIAALEDARYAEPDDASHAVALADAYLGLLHPDWALATTSQFATAKDHRVHLVRATARAERLESPECLVETKAGLAACDAEGAEKCPPGVRIRFDMISSAMQALVDQGIDPRKDPKRARQAVAEVLHSAKTRPPKKK
jgi:hypothetical protein